VDPIPTKGQTLWYSLYTIISLSMAVLVLRAAGFVDDASKTEESLTKKPKLNSLLIKRKVGNQGWNNMYKSYACSYLSFLQSPFVAKE
jgi:hypothetical protein